MDDVDDFLASLDQFSSPTIESGIQQQVRRRGGGFAQPNAPPTSSNDVANRETNPSHTRGRRRARESDALTLPPSGVSLSAPPRSFSTDLLNQRDPPHGRGSGNSSAPRAGWWCVRCAAENSVDMQSCAICHRRRHRVEGPPPELNSSFGTNPSRASVELTPSTLPASSSSLLAPSSAGSGGRRDEHDRAAVTVSDVDRGPASAPPTVEVACPRCTFLNPSSRRVCEMCEGPLPPPPRSLKAEPFFASLHPRRDGFPETTGTLAERGTCHRVPETFEPILSGVVPSTVLPSIGGEQLRSSAPAVSLPPEPLTTPSGWVNPRARLLQAAQPTLSLTPATSKGTSSASSSSSSSDNEDDDQGNESDVGESSEAGSGDVADHHELVRFLETLQSVKFDRLPCAAVPTTLQAHANLHPFQLQALYWLRSREQPLLNLEGGPHNHFIVPSGNKMKGFTVERKEEENGGPWLIADGRAGREKVEASLDAERWFEAPSEDNVEMLSRCAPSSGFAAAGCLKVDADSDRQSMTRNVRGGVFADYMGLGKTRTLVALCEAERASPVDRVTGSLVESTATLIVCPTSLLAQWVDEIQRCVQRPSESPLRILVYYGTRKRRLSVFQVAQSYDYVLTTYQTLCHERPPASHYRPEGNDHPGMGSHGGMGGVGASDYAAGVLRVGAFESCPTLNDAEDYSVDRHLQAEVGKLFMIRWHRIILDEAHYIRNMRTLQSRACLKLAGVRRWVVTATPVQNSLNDLYPLLRFLQVPHFSSLNWWNEEIVRYYNMDPRHPRPVTALNILFGSILLRRTPDSMVEGRPILQMPPKHIITRTIALSRDEMRFFEAIRAKAIEKLGALRDREATAAPHASFSTFTTAFEMLVRCRQTCLHPYIVVAALRRSHRLSSGSRRGACGTGAGTRDANELDLEHPPAASPTTEEGKIATQREEEQRMIRATEQFVQNVVLRRLRAANTKEFVQALVAEIKSQQLELRECVICLDTVNRPAILPCAHVFCEDCIMHALQATRRCPLCKRNSKLSELLLVPVELLNRVASSPEGGNDSAAPVAGLQGSSGRGESTSAAPPEVPLSLDLTNLSNWSLQLSSKTQYLVNTIQALPVTDKVVVFSAFLTYLRFAQHCLEAAGISCVTYSGSMTMKQKQHLLASFHDAERPDSPRVLLATISSCGVGLNLTAANHCFLMEPSWNPGTEEQALNRIHRIGQTKPVTITKLIAEGTIDQNINQLCERKRALSGYCFGDGDTPVARSGSSGGRLRTADLLELFAPEAPTESSSSSSSSSSNDDEESENERVLRGR